MADKIRLTKTGITAPMYCEPAAVDYWVNERGWVIDPSDQTPPPPGSQPVTHDELAAIGLADLADVTTTGAAVDDLVGFSGVGGSPAFAPRRSAPYDAARSLNKATAANLRKIRATVGKAIAGTNLCRIGFIGDSVTAGPDAGSTDPGTRLVENLRAMGYGSSRVVHLHSAVGIDSDVIVTNGWSTGATPTQPWWSFTGTGGTVTVRGRGTVLEIVTRGDSAAFTYSVDGATPVAITPSGTAAVQTVTVSGLSDGPHLVTIASATGTSYLYAVGFRPDTGLVIENAGVGSSTSAQWVSTSAGAFAPLASMITRNCDVVFVELGINDYAGTASSVVEANLTNIIGQLQTAGTAVVLVLSHRINGADATWDTNVVAAAYRVSTAKAVPLVDLGDVFGDYATWGTALGLAKDTVHLNAAGAAAKAQVLAAALNIRPVGGSLEPRLRDAETALDSLVFAASPVTDFSGLADGAAWPTPWTVNGASPGDVQSTAGRLATLSSAYAQANAVRAGVADGQIVYRWRLNNTVSERYSMCYFRYVGTNGYRLSMTAGSIQLHRLDSGTPTTLATISSAQATATDYLVRIRWVGSRLQAKVWADGTREPSRWLFDTVDGTYSAAGNVQLSVQTGSAGGVQELVVDNIVLSDASGPGARIAALEAAREPQLPSGYYFHTTASVTSATSATLGVGTLRVAPWKVTRPISLNRLVAEVTTAGEAGAKVRLGVYADDGFARPGALVVDAGQIAGDVVGKAEVTISTTLAPGIYWVGGVVQAVVTTQPTVIVIPQTWEPPIRVPASAGTTLGTLNGSVLGHNMTGVTGALPATFTSSGVTTNVPRVSARAA